MIRCQSSTAPNLQLVLPTQALPPVADPEPTNEDVTDEEVASSRMVPFKKLSKQLSPQNNMVIAIITPHDTAGSNVALNAALRADKSMSRCSKLHHTAPCTLPHVVSGCSFPIRKQSTF